MIKKLIYTLIFFCAATAHSQDIHFSQFTRTEFLINPAYTGTFQGNLRATMNWKDQWRAINNTFRTFASSAEFSFGKGRARKPTFYALGMYAAKDVSGDVELGTTNFGANFATLLKISRNQRLSFGIQGAYGRSGINSTNLQWGSQYSGLSFDPSLFDGEGVEYLPQQYWDFSAGIAYWYHKNDKNVIYGAPADGKIGFAVYHINGPNNSYAVGEKQKIPMRAVFNASALFATPVTDLYWYPNLTAQLQGAQHQLYFGALAKYAVQSGSKMTGFGKDISFAAGVNFRVTNVLDAVVPQLLFDIQPFSIGLSYDINTSKLNAASNYRGGFELSLRFTNPDGYTHRNPYRRGTSI